MSGGAETYAGAALKRPAADSAPSAAAVAASLELAAMVIENGGTTFSCTRAFHVVLAVLGQRDCDLFVRIDALIASQRGDVLGMRRLGAIRTNLARTESAADLAERIARHDLTLDELSLEIERLRRLPAPYSIAHGLLAVGVGSAAFALLAGGDRGAAVIAAAAGITGRLIRHHLVERKIFVSSTTLLAALGGALFAGLALRSGLSISAGPALLGSMMHLVPGVMLLNGVWDIATGRYLVMGLQRLAFAAMLFVALGLALAVGASISGGG
jgi:uncharacterized membrane protein YjjP (DUF1212 family)